jgi:electron-transferring-flavoprotein dehydrogenase
MVAAEAIFNALKEAGEVDKTKPLYLSKYPEMLKRSWLWDDLYKGILTDHSILYYCHVTYDEISTVRNIRPSFQLGTLPGMIYTGADMVMRGREPWTLHHKHEDHSRLKPAKECKPIDYPKPDGKISFDLLTNLSRSGT